MLVYAGLLLPIPKIKFEDWKIGVLKSNINFLYGHHLFLKDPVGIIRSFQLTTGQRRISQLIALSQEESQGQVLVTVKSCMYLFDANEKYT